MLLWCVLLANHDSFVGKLQILDVDNAVLRIISLDLDRYHFISSKTIETENKSQLRREIQFFIT